MSAIHVLGICGSLRAGSYNRMLLHAARELVPEGMTMTTFERLAEIPPYNADHDVQPGPPSVEELRRAMREADALLFVTPEYNYGIPGGLKNAIDWASRPPATTPLKGKAASIMGAATGMVGTARAQLSLRQCFVFTQTYPLQAPEILVSKAAEKFDAEGRLTDDTTREVVRANLVLLRDWAIRLR